MMPSWLEPPMPQHQGTVRIVVQSWTSPDDPREPRKHQWKNLGERTSPRLQAILELVREHPGLTAAELQPMTKDTVRWMLRNLKRRDKVRAEGERGAFRYYVV